MSHAKIGENYVTHVSAGQINPIYVKTLNQTLAQLFQLIWFARNETVELDMYNPAF
jgi:hypothetical protein